MKDLKQIREINLKRYKNFPDEKKTFELAWNEIIKIIRPRMCSECAVRLFPREDE